MYYRTKLWLSHRLSFVLFIRYNIKVAEFSCFVYRCTSRKICVHFQQFIFDRVKLLKNLVKLISQKNNAVVIKIALPTSVILYLLTFHFGFCWKKNNNHKILWKFQTIKAKLKYPQYSQVSEVNIFHHNKKRVQYS